MRPPIGGPVPALVSITTSAVFLYLALLMVDDANMAAPRDKPPQPDDPLLFWGGNAFLASLATGTLAVLFWILRRRQGVDHPHVPEGVALAPAIGLVEAAQGFVLRLHSVLLATGGLVLVGGLGLLAAASLVADGTARGPFPLPGKIWVVRLDVWQVQVTTWAFLLLSIALGLWASEYRCVRRLRAAWTAPPPEV